MTARAGKTIPILVAAVLIAPTQAKAYTTFFGEDLNNSNNFPLASYPNATNAEAAFKANLVGVGTETFESFATNKPEPLNLSFPGSVGNLTAELSGGGGAIRTVTPPNTNGFGRYAISGSNFWEVEAGGSGDFTVTFGQDIAAFGFYGVDIGDFGGQLELELSNGNFKSVNVPNTKGLSGSTDGSVLFFGILTDDQFETFKKVRFLTSTGQGDVFAFDNFTIGEIEQVKIVPVPAALPIALAAFGGFGFAGWRQRKSA